LSFINRDDKPLNRDFVKSPRQYSRSHDAVIRVYDAAGDVIQTHEHAGDPLRLLAASFQRAILFNDAHRKFLTLPLIIGPPLL
jgi:hypothetical protein